jgi:dipeptidyl aminopeptidase/acylaminoacyl peptidase
MMLSAKSKFIGLLLGLVFCICSILVFSSQEDLKAEHSKKMVLSDEAFQAILQFYQYDKEIPLDAIVIESSDEKDYVREKIVFRGANDYRVPGYLAIPKTGVPPYPCVMQIHGMTLSKEDFWRSDSYHRGHLLSQALLAEGFAVLALDAQYHGERIIFNDFQSTLVMVFRKGWINRLREMTTQTVMDYRRAIDYLETRKEIDLNRIGVIGYSLGGVESFILTGVDPRIKVLTACVTPSIIRQRWPDQHNLSAIAPTNFVRAIKGRAILMLMGRNDEFNCTVEEARSLYNLIEGESKELVFYDSGHRLPEEHVSKVLKWFKNYLE